LLVATSSSRATKKRVALLRTNTRMTSSMMGAKNRKRPANAFKTRRATRVQARRRPSSVWTRLKQRMLAMTKTRQILTKICLKKRMKESGAIIKKAMNTT
jgi:hypothetical protein